MSLEWSKCCLGFKGKVEERVVSMFGQYMFIQPCRSHDVTGPILRAYNIT